MALFWATGPGLEDQILEELNDEKIKKENKINSFEITDTKRLIGKNKVKDSKET